MSNVLKEVYESLVLNGSAWVSPPLDERDSLEGFQAVYQFAKDMQEDGLILIRQTHRESQTAARMIDRFQIMRLR
jgi:hypothetical protein